MDTFGTRLKSLRGLLGLSRKEFSGKHGFSEFTIRSWELGKTNINKNQLKKVLDAFEIENLVCDAEWLLYGKGTSPFVTRALLKQNNIDNYKIKGALLEADFFQENNYESIITRVTDQLMAPFFYVGDLVGGVPISEENVHSLVGRHVIVVTYKDQIFVRILLPSDKKDLYTFTCTNLEKIKEGYLHEVQIKKIYKIVWIRRD